MELIDRMRHRLQSGALIYRGPGIFFLALTAIFSAHSAAPGSEASRSETVVFRYHVPYEPNSLDPAKLTSTDASYFFNNIMRGLYSYSNEKGLVPEGAKDCRFESPLLLRCDLNSLKWSDGQTIEAGDYLRTFKRLLASTSRNPSVELLKHVKNAHLGTNLGPLGITAPRGDQLVFEFSEPDPEFLYKLTASVLAPTRLDTYPKRGELTGLVFNGPYKVTSWSLGHRIHLEPNPYYAAGEASRPPVEVLFIDDDETALHLYEDKGLSLLRRLPTTYIPTYRKRADFMQIPVARFDYIGFGPDLKNEPELRQALSLSADFRELQKIYDALGRPGCPALPERLIDRERCVDFDLKAAKEALARVSPASKQKRYHMMFSKLGGDDIKKGMEWFQSQWKKNLGITVDLEQMEQGSYLALLRERAPAIFRKGIGLERPTCLAALENFSPQGSENFLDLDDAVFSKHVHDLEHAAALPIALAGPHPTKGDKEICGAAVQRLEDEHYLIPLGRIHFTLLADPAFTGWTLNEMNQLDLARLSYRQDPSGAHR